jgi:protein TonB
MQMAYPRYQLNAPPTYPGLARKRGQEGTVFLKVLVNKEGRVDELEIKTSSGFTLLDRAAVSAVRKWSFEPGRRGEERVPMWVRVPVTFKLNK